MEKTPLLIPEATINTTFAGPNGAKSRFAKQATIAIARQTTPWNHVTLATSEFFTSSAVKPNARGTASQTVGTSIAGCGGI